MKGSVFFPRSAFIVFFYVFAFRLGREDKE